jgi:DNA replication protein DnaC
MTSHISAAISRLETALHNRSPKPKASTAIVSLRSYQDLEGFHTCGDPVLEKMLDAAVSYLTSIRTGGSPCWMTLWGTNGKGNGTGKTHLARLIAAAVRNHLPQTPAACTLNWPKLCTRWQAREDTGHKLGFARECGLLIIDDAGAEHQSAATVSLLQDLLNSRLGKWTIITSNLSPEEWSARDHRIASRLIRDGSFLVQCETVDYANRPHATP